MTRLAAVEDHRRWAAENLAKIAARLAGLLNEPDGVLWMRAGGRQPISVEKVGSKILLRFFSQSRELQSVLDLRHCA